MTKLSMDPDWPALVARVEGPLGQITGATFDAATGLLLSSTDSSTFRDVGSVRHYATTSYAWHPKWEFVTRVTPPEDSSTTVAYDPSNGNRTWQQRGGDTTRFHYYGSGLLKVVEASNGARDSIGYDAAGNLAIARTALGFATYAHKDSLGRDTLVISPIAVSDTTALRQGSTTAGHRVRTYYDAAGRDTLVVSSAGNESLRVRKRYDAEGNLDSLVQSGTPDLNVIGSIVRFFNHDELDRTISEGVQGSEYIHYFYDEAGNLVGGGRVNGAVVRTYDALNRLVRRGGNTFTYDRASRLLTADNMYARIARSYNANGTLRVDTLRIGITDSTAQDFSQHVYGFEFEYDLSGRRTLMEDFTGSSQSYSYDHRTGQLAKIVDPSDLQYGYYYDLMGQLDSLVRREGLTSSILETRRYDLDGRLTRRTQRNNTTEFHDDSLVYDARGKVLHQLGLGGPSDHLTYGPLGALIAADIGDRDETFEMDPLGNRYSYSRVAGQTPTEERNYYEAGTGRLQRRTSTPGQQAVADDTTHYEYDNKGNTRQTHTVSVYPTETWNYYQYVHRYNISVYDAENRMVLSRFRQDTTFGSPGAGYGDPTVPYLTTETYRYDALGRRIWTRSIKPYDCHYVQASSGCESWIIRTMWDGDQILAEFRAEGSDTVANVGVHESDNNSRRYTHGTGIDEPLYVSSGVHPFADWRGTFDNGTCPEVKCTADQVWFPGSSATAYGAGTPPNGGPPSWHGSLIEHQSDPSGLQYRRNRYYDPRTGRFTQEDPIGLAGGLNLYGYANGDPVSYSDLFGLCKNEKGEERRCEVKWSSEASDTSVTKEMRETAQALADAADVDLQLSSGRRGGGGDDCSESRHNCGRAIDINAINGIDVGQETVVNPAAAALVEQVQEAAMGLSQVRENYGPAGLFKSAATGRPQQKRYTTTTKLMNLQLGHMDHVHISIH